jgi:inosine/xanthosine triphosphate pyrophosphatase family protein
VEQVALELDEIQTTSVAEIAQHQARQAFAILGRPLFVEDSGFYIEEFGGWPGPMVKQALEPFGPGGFTHLADLTEKRTCRFASAAVYVDARGELRTFADDSRKPGSIASAPDRGDGPRSWSDLWSICVPEGATATLAALPPAEQEQVFAEWRAAPWLPRWALGCLDTDDCCRRRLKSGSVKISVKPIVRLCAGDVPSQAA